MRALFRSRKAAASILRTSTALLFLGMLVAATTCIADDQLIRSDGRLDQEKFDRDWRKYSDIDERIPLESRSWEAQQYGACLEEIGQARVEIARLKALMELDRQARLAMRDYQQALAKGLKANLLKSFWRLSWITYNTIGGASGQRGLIDTGKDLAEFVTEPFMNKFLTESSKIATFGRTAAIAKKFIPKAYSKLPGASGKVVNVGLDALLDGMKSYDENPTKLATNLVTAVTESGGDEILTTEGTDPELSEAELAILRTQNNDLQLMKGMIAASYQINEDRQARIDVLENQIGEAQQRAGEWEKQEKDRVLAKIALEQNKPHELKVSLSAPKQIAIGETATISAEVSGESGRYKFQWFAAKQGDQRGFARAASNPGGNSIGFRGSSTGLHSVALNVVDQEDHVFGQGGVTIEVVDPPITATRPSGIQPAPPPGAGTPLETLTVIRDGGEGGHTTAMATIPGKKYSIEVSGLVTVRFYSEKGTYLGTDQYDAAYTAKRFDYKWDPSSANPNWDFDQVVGPQIYNAKSLTLLINKPCCASPSSNIESFKPYFGSSITPTYSKQHVYKFEYPGDGKPIRFYFWYPEVSIHHKSGGFIVRIFESPDLQNTKR